MREGQFKRSVLAFLIGNDESYSELNVVGRLNRLFWFSAKHYAVDRNNMRAVALTYWTLFALVPLLALGFGIAKGFMLDEKLKVLLEEKFANQQEALNHAYAYADKLLENTQGGVIAGVGVIFLLWTVMSLAGNIEKSFNAIWNLPPRGNLFRRFSDYLTLLIVTPFLLIVLSSAGPVIRQLFTLVQSKCPWISNGTYFAATLLAELFPLLLLCGIFSIIYFVAPNTRVRFKSALLAGIIAGLLFQLLQDGFIFLQTHIYRFNKVYGSFAALPLFLIWLQWSWKIALFGGEISFTHQHIGSGLFDRMGNAKLSYTLRRRYQLLILSKIYGTFDRGQGALDEEKLFELVPLPQVLLLSMVEELLEAGLIYKREDDRANNSYLPAHPTERFSICDAQESLNRSGWLRPLTGSGNEFEQITSGLARIEDDSRRNPGNLLLKDIRER